MQTKLLIAIESPILRKAVEVALSPLSVKAGLSLALCSSGEEARELLAEEKVDLAIMDAGRELLPREARLKRLLLASPGEKEALEAQGLGGELLAKPFSQMELLQAIERALGQSLDAETGDLEIGGAEDEVLARMEERVLHRAEKLVLDYCQQNFRALAREILREELRKLAGDEGLMN